MRLEALVVSRDAPALRVIHGVLGGLGVLIEECPTPAAALDLLNVRKFDAVIVDCDDLHGAPEVLRHLRQAPSNRTSVAFAIVNGITSVANAFNLGANFVLDKPITLDRSSRSLRAAHGLMMRERRRYFRQAVEMPVQLTTPAGSELRAGATNLSDCGMAVRIESPLTLPGTYRVRFTLPATRVTIGGNAELVWTDGQAHAGFRFVHLHEGMRLELQDWLAQRFDQQQAAAVLINATRSQEAR